MNPKPKVNSEQTNNATSLIFLNPLELGRYNSLTREKKIELLHQLEYDAKELAIAEAEGMAGGEASNLGRILNLIASLEVSS